MITIWQFKFREGFQLALLFLVFFSLQHSDVAAQKKIKIGVSLPLTGDSASEGEDLRSMLNFANKHIGQGAYDLIFEDDQCNDKQAVSIAHKFVDIDDLKYVLGFACSGAVLASAPVYDKGKVVTIALATGAPEISRAGDFIFRTIPNLKVAAQKLYRHINGRFKNIALLSEETAYCQGLAQAFLTENVDPSVKIISENYLPGATDFRTTLAKFKAKGVEAIFLNPQSETGMINLYRQFLSLQWKIPVYAVYYPSFSNFLKTFGDRADGVVFADLPFVSDALNDQGRKLYESYKKENGTPRSSEFYFITALAAFEALHSAIRSGQDIRSYLYNHKFDGLFGEFSFDQNGDVVGDRLSFVLKTLSHGQPKLIE